MQDNILPSINPADLSGVQNNAPSFDLDSILDQSNTASFDSYLNPCLLPAFKIPSKNYTSSQVGEQLSKLDERKRRRMISNRESAKRSRTRQRGLLKELCSSVMQLQNENYQLINKLNHMEDCNGSILQENVRLKEEASILYQMLQNLQPENSHVAQNK